MTSHRQRKSQGTETEREAAFKGHREDTVENTWLEGEDQEMRSLHMGITHS